MKPKILVTDETRLIVEASLQKKHKQIEKRLAKVTLERVKKDIDMDEKKEYKYVGETEPMAEEFKTSVFSKHIEKLAKIKRTVDNRVTVGGISLIIDKKDEQRVEAASRYIETAMAMLATIKKDY